MSIHPGSERGSDRVKPTLRQRPCNSGPHVSCSLSSVTYWFDTLAVGNYTSLRHLSIAWELTRKHARALHAINVRKHGGTMSLTGIVRAPLSFSRQYVGAVHRSAIHGLSQIRRELCACHRADQALATSMSITTFWCPTNIEYRQSPKIVHSQTSLLQYLGLLPAPIIDHPFKGAPTTNTKTNTFVLGPITSLSTHNPSINVTRNP